MPNRFTPINSQSSDQAKWAQVNKNFAALDSEGTRKSFKNKRSGDGFVLGQLRDDLGTGFIMNDLNQIPAIYGAVDADGNPILKVAKAGEDATTASDDDLVFNSARNFFKIVDSGEASVAYTAPATSQVFNTQIRHGQTGTPIVQAFLDLGSARVQVPYYVLGYGGTPLLGVAAGFWVTSDVDFLTFTVLASSVVTPGTAIFKYYIIAESAA